LFRNLLIALVAASASSHALAQCVATASTLKSPFVPPPPYRAVWASPERVWYGSDALWTAIAPAYRSIGKTPISVKVAYWRVGFDWLDEPRPDLTVVAKRLDGPAQIVSSERPSSGKLPGDDNPTGMAMVTTIRFPSEGCWEVAATYRGKTLTYVVAVVP
jgi:hypothetical protein